jgi:pyridoxal phosphate enzyme (YggS family)
MSGVASRLSSVTQALAQATSRTGRSPSSVTLVAVSKRHSVESMRDYVAAATAMGIPVVFGESYVQELKTKRAEFSSQCHFHLIGPLQSNKIREAVRLADVIESVHSVKVIQRIAAEARALGKRQSIFLQVNIGQDPRKSGFSKDHVADACTLVWERREDLALRGLMTITPYYDVPEDVRRDFHAMRELRSYLIEKGVGSYFEDQTIRLSMGMSSDFEIAIEEGADLIRVGTLLFGERADDETSA